jgi:hypothetical protein
MASWVTSPRTVRASVDRVSRHRVAPITVTVGGLSIDGLTPGQARQAARMLGRRSPKR